MKYGHEDHADYDAVAGDRDFWLPAGWCLAMTKNAVVCGCFVVISSLSPVWFDTCIAMSERNQNSVTAAYS